MLIDNHFRGRQDAALEMVFCQVSCRFRYDEDEKVSIGLFGMVFPNFLSQIAPAILFVISKRLSSEIRHKISLE